MASKLKNCPVCGKLFAAEGAQRMCRNCFIKEQEKELEVTNFVRDHPKSKIPEIVEGTGASEKLIKRMIAEGRFMQVGVKLTYPCEKCGEPIMKGKYCDKCLAEMQKDIQDTQSKMSAKKEAADAAARGHGMRSKEHGRKIM